MNCRRMTHWYGTALPVAGLGAPFLNAAGIARRAAATGVVIFTSVTLVSITWRPVSSQAALVATFMAAQVFQSASTSSYATSPQTVSESGVRAGGRAEAAGSGDRP